jgi:hypothetical protein
VVEPVDLVDEQQRALPALPSSLRRLEHLPQVRDTGERRRQRFEREVRLLREKPGDGGLAAAGRPPQQPVRPDHPADRSILGQEVALTDDVGQGAGSQPIRQRPRSVIHLEQARRLLGHDRSSS